MSETPTPPSNDEFSDRIAEGVSSRVTKGKAILNSCSNRLLEAIYVDGKNLSTWAEELRVDIPESAQDDPDGIDRALSATGRAIQKGEYLLGVFEIHGASTTNYHEEQLAKRYVEIMDSDGGGSKVAAEKIRQRAMADGLVDAALATKQVAEMISEFFKRLLKGLEETRKTLESQVVLLGIRAKHLRDQ